MCLKEALKQSDLQQSTAVLHSIRCASLFLSAGDLVSGGIGRCCAGVELWGVFPPRISVSLHGSSFTLHGRISVGLLMLGEVVAACEALVAQQAGELLFPRVGAHVPL